MTRRPDYYQAARAAAKGATIPRIAQEDESQESLERRTAAKQAASAARIVLSVNRQNDNSATLPTWREAHRLMNSATEKAETLLRSPEAAQEEWAGAAAGFREFKGAIERRIAYLEGRASLGG